MYFKDEFEFLSNFYPSPINHEGRKYPTVEHFYQAMKTLDHTERSMIRLSPTPGKAKRLGRDILLRSDWEDVRFSYMSIGVHIKFHTHPHLRQKLLAIPKTISEWNTWHDNYWGACTCENCMLIHPEDKLGYILQTIRELYWVEYEI